MSAKVKITLFFPDLDTRQAMEMVTDELRAGKLLAFVEHVEINKEESVRYI